MNDAIYLFAQWLDSTAWSTALHESFYLYNWIESTHVLALMLSLGLLCVVDLRMLGLAFSKVDAAALARQLQWPMLLGFGVMIITGLLLYYAIPVRTSQSLWFRIKLVLLVAAGVNALVFHRHMLNAADGWSSALRAPVALRRGALLSLSFWMGIVVCGRLIAYDWFDCARQPSGLISALAGCVPDQEVF